jgi:hypothetical protein
MSTDGEVANALVCKTSIHGFKSHSVLQHSDVVLKKEMCKRCVPPDSCARLLRQGERLCTTLGCGLWPNNRSQGVHVATDSIAGCLLHNGAKQNTAT